MKLLSKTLSFFAFIRQFFDIFTVNFTTQSTTQPEKSLIQSNCYNSLLPWHGSACGATSYLPACRGTAAPPARSIEHEPISLRHFLSKFRNCNLLQLVGISHRSLLQPAQRFDSGQTASVKKNSNEAILGTMGHYFGVITELSTMLTMPAQWLDS